MILSRLAIHYYRPDFTEGQAKLLIADMVEDLREYSPDVVADACSEYRRKADSKFFPNSGTLRALALEIVKHRNEAAKKLRPLPDSRPLCWWLKPRNQWKTHWHESEIPRDQRFT